MVYQLPKLTCLNCKRVVLAQERAPKNILPKSCPWCSKPIASRASNRKMKRSK